MIFHHHVITEFLEEVAFLERGCLFWVLSHSLECMTWRLRFIISNKKLTAQCCVHSKPKQMPLPGCVHLSQVLLIYISSPCSILRSLRFMLNVWQDKESLITELRKELRVSDDEHRELLARVNSDDIIREIRLECSQSNWTFTFNPSGRHMFLQLYCVMFWDGTREWRQAGGHLNVRRSSSQPIHDVVPSPTVSASRKKQKTSQLVGFHKSILDSKPYFFVALEGFPPFFAATYE